MLAANKYRHNTDAYATINSVQPNGTSVKIDWADGHESIFHTIWLRDNCTCDECGDHSGGHRFFELNMLPDSAKVRHANVDEGRLSLVWENDGHATQYDPAWLRAHCYSDSERQRRRHQPILWDATLAGNVPEANYRLAQEDDAEKLKIYDAVRTHGLCLLRDVPAKSEATEEVAGMLGYVRETHYGLAPPHRREFP